MFRLDIRLEGIKFISYVINVSQDPRVIDSTFCFVWGIGLLMDLWIAVCYEHRCLFEEAYVLDSATHWDSSVELIWNVLGFFVQSFDNFIEKLSRPPVMIWKVQIIWNFMETFTVERRNAEKKRNAMKDFNAHKGDELLLSIFKP